MEEIIRVSLVILPRGAVKSPRIYTSTHGDVVIKKKKKKKWEDGCFALCCVWQPPRTHGFGTSPPCSAGGRQTEGRKFSSPTSGLEISLFLGSIKQTSSGLASLAFGEGLAGEGGHSCCYTQSRAVTEARLWADWHRNELHGPTPGPSPSVLLGQEDAAVQPNGPCVY